MTGRSFPLGRHRAVLLALALPGVALALWVLARSRGRDSTPSSTERTRGVEKDVPREPLPRSEDERAHEPEANRTAEPLLAPTRESGGHPQGLIVEVVDEEGGAIANAPVLVLRYPRHAPENPFERKQVDAQPTGTDGRAVFELEELSLGRDTDSVEEVTIGPGLPGAPRQELPRDVADGTVVRLVVAASLVEGQRGTRVRVVDSAGQPAGGVSVVWGVRSEKRTGGRVQIGASNLGSAVSDPATGIAELPWLALCSAWPKSRGPEEDGRYRAEASALFDDPVLLDLGTALPVDEIPTLTVPASGTLEVRVEQQDGRPVSSGSVLVAVLGTESWCDAPLRDGQARFRALGLGHELAITTWTDDGRGARREVIGPRWAGETVSATLRLAPFGPDVHLAAVDERGVPLAGVEIEVDTLHLEDDVHHFPVLHTDGAGRANLRVPRSGFRDGHSYLDLSADAARNAALFGDLYAAVPIGPPTDATTLDLGVVVFEGPPPSAREPLLSGRVVDDGGAPLAGAEVAVEPYESEDEWRVTARSASDGGFELFGPAAEVLQLWVSTEDHLPEKLDDLEAGTRDCIVRLTRAARFEARLALAPDVPEGLLELGLDGPEQRYLLGAPHVLLRDLVPGEYALRVRTVQGRWLVARVDGLALGSDASVDSRLEPLDLRDALQVCRFRLESAGRGPLFDVSAIVRVERLGDGPARTDEEGRLVLLLPAEATYVEIHPPGHVAVRAEPSNVERVLAFDPE